jgi:undecaprenyl-diphosphatase
VIGSVIPGSSIVFLGGVLVGLHALELWQVVDAAVAGAILGDGLSYWIGHRYHAELRAMWPLRTHPELLERGQAYFAAHGGKSVFVGRFLGPLRAIVPVVAGMSRMPARQFYTMNVLSACAWAAAHLLPGVLFGASLQVAGAVSSRLVALVALVVLGLWLVAQATRLAIRFGWPYVSRMCRRALIRASKGSGVIARLALPLVDPARREPGTLFVAAVLLIGGTWLFFGVIEDLLTRDALVYADRGVYEWLQAIRTGWGDDVMVAITQLGGAPVLIPVVAAVGAWFAVTRRWRTLAYWVAATAIAELLVFALKHAFGRARPDAALALVDGFSFPSGHAALSVVVYGFLAFLLGNRKPGWQRTGLALAAVCIAALTAFSRLYLGAHWLSDVIASFGLGTAWVALLAIAHMVHVRDRPLRVAPVLLIVLATLIVVGGPYAGSHRDRDLARYAKTSEVPTLRFAAWQAGGWRTLPAAQRGQGRRGRSRCLSRPRCDQPPRAGKMPLPMIACTPQLPSTTWVMPKSTATDISEIASSSLKPCVDIRKWRIL